ncbi:hypothetical protein D3C84_744870 [compost metagenome]
MLDALGHAHGRPQPLTPVIGADGGVEGRQCSVGVEQWRTAEDDLFVAVRTGQVHRAADLGEGAWPGFQLTVDQVFTLLGLAVEAVFFRDVAGRGKQVAKDLCCGHVATPSGLGDADKVCYRYAL